MATCIELYIEDDGTLSVSMEEKEAEEASVEEGGETEAPKGEPVETLQEAIAKIRSMAQGILSNQESGGFSEGFGPTGGEPQKLKQQSVMG